MQPSELNGRPRLSELAALDIRRGRHSTYLGYRPAANPYRSKNEKYAASVTFRH